MPSGGQQKARHCSWRSRSAGSLDNSLSGQSAPATCTKGKSPVMKKKRGPNKIPRLRTDEEAEAFLNQDLSNVDFSQFKAARFEFEKKTARVNMRLPQPLLEAVKKRASQRRIPYQRFIREALEKAVIGK
ncbi:MAG TPA: CopG family antitoxin [Micropepsaceae bacterium]|nr:CopG family antitoxin [Micropepsaceae bacterium]